MGLQNFDNKSGFLVQKIIFWHIKCIYIMEIIKQLMILKFFFWAYWEIFLGKLELFNFCWSYFVQFFFIFIIIFNNIIIHKIINFRKFKFLNFCCPLTLSTLWDVKKNILEWCRVWNTKVYTIRLPRYREVFRKVKTVSLA